MIKLVAQTSLFCSYLVALIYLFLIPKPIASWPVEVHSCVLGFYANDQILVTWSHHRTDRIEVWRVATHERLATLPVLRYLNLPEFSISADGSTIAWVQVIDDKEVLLAMRFDDRQVIGPFQSLPRKGEGVRASVEPQLNSDGSLLLFRPGNVLQCWDVKTQKHKKTFGDGHFTSIASDDGRLLLTWTRAGNVPGESQLWDFQSLERINTLEPTPIFHVVHRIFSRNNSSIHAVQYPYRNKDTGEVTFLKWDLRAGKRLETAKVKISSNEINNFPLVPKTVVIISLWARGSKVAIYDWETGILRGNIEQRELDETPREKLPDLITGMPSPGGGLCINQQGKIAITADGRYLACSYSYFNKTTEWWKQQLSRIGLASLVRYAGETRVRIFDLSTCELAHQFEFSARPSYSQNRVAITEVDSRIALVNTGNENARLEIWELIPQRKWGWFVLCLAPFVYWYSRRFRNKPVSNRLDT